MKERKLNSWTRMKGLCVLPMAMLALNVMAVPEGEEVPMIDAVSAATELTAPKEAADDDKVYEKAEVNPEFPGGADALMKYIAANVQYPAEAQESGVEGRVMCQFVVTKTGELMQVKVVKSPHPFLSKEAIRLIEAMPKWKPGTQDGVAVNVKYTLPVMFRLGQDGSQEKGKEVFEDPEVMPEFLGGKSALMQYLAENVRYPAEAQAAGIQGRVMCQFVVTKTGEVTQVKVAKSVDPALDREAVRLVTEMPRWKPGTMAGKPVNVRYTLPISFNLN